MNPDEVRARLNEGIARVIESVTEEAVDYDPIVWLQAEALVESVVGALFDEEEKESDDMEELCADMDQFVKE